jgi:glycogen debranching enzyme
MLCEACSRLAALTDREDEAKEWLNESKRVLGYLINELWDGEQFRAKVLATGEKYKCGCIAQLQPALLGSRLPKEILHKLAQRLTDPEEYLTDYGIASENLKSDKLMMRSFTRGPVVAPAQMLIISGLYEGGETETAVMLASRYLNAFNSEGLALGIHPYRTEPLSGEEIKPVNSGMSVGFPFSSWVASIYLALAQNVLKC